MRKDNQKQDGFMYVSMSMLTEAPLRYLSTDAKLLYIACGVESYGATKKPIHDYPMKYHSIDGDGGRWMYFYMPWKIAVLEYGIGLNANRAGMQPFKVEDDKTAMSTARSRFTKAMRSLVDAGLVEVVLSGRKHRPPNCNHGMTIYRMFVKYGHKNASVKQ